MKERYSGAILFQFCWIEVFRSVLEVMVVVLDSGGASRNGVGCLGLGCYIVRQFHMLSKVQADKTHTSIEVLRHSKQASWSMQLIQAGE